MAAGLTQEELAARLGLTVRAIREMERGRSARPYQRSVRLLAEALSLTGRLAWRSCCLARPGAHCFEGLLTRTAATLAAHTLLLTVLPDQG
jgi:transcriptional regulator with XRE-family HTH domain